jgi:hypothetical protein
MLSHVNEGTHEGWDVPRYYAGTDGNTNIDTGVRHPCCANAAIWAAAARAYLQGQKKGIFKETLVISILNLKNWPISSMECKL